MKRRLTILALLVFVFLPTHFLNAECNDEEAKKIAENVKVELVTEEDGEHIYHVVRISNIVEGVYLIVKEDDANTVTRYSVENVPDNFLEIIITNIFFVINYEVEVYSDTENCKDQLINNIKVSTKKFNDLYDSVPCQLNPDYSKCEYFSDTEGMTAEELANEIEEFNHKQNMSSKDKAIEILKKYGVYVLVPLFIIGGIYTFKIISVKRKEIKK